MELNRIYHSDTLTGLRGLPDESVDCIVTSPPYWQMRDYGIPPTLWGGDPACVHEPDRYGFCELCGGWLGQLGQEPNRDEFISHLCMIFDECRRVLKSSGTLWCNLSDSYSKPYKYNLTVDQKKYGMGKNTHCLTKMKVDKGRHRIASKSLCNIPGRFADEMILRGWILRNEIIWYKPSVIPTPAKDRFTVDFEKMFFFVKHPEYAFEQQFEPYAASTPSRYRRNRNMVGKNLVYRRISGMSLEKPTLNPKGRNMRCVWRIATENGRENHFAPYPTRLVETPIRAGCPPGGVVLDPFMGTGTTAVVARRLGRSFIGFDLNPEYVEISNRRCEKG